MEKNVKLAKKVLITLGREYGSAGHIVAERLGRKLDIPVFDKNLITIIAKKHGLDESTLLSSDERIGSLFFDSYAPYGPESGSVSERLFIMQSNIIKQEADKGSAIFVGRCANDILRKYDDVLNFFIFAPKAARISYIMEADDIADAAAAEKIIRRMDKASAPKKAAFAKGDKVMHRIMGDGEILDINSEKGAYVIKFADIDTPREISFKAKLEKIL